MLYFNLEGRSFLWGAKWWRDWILGLFDSWILGPCDSVASTPIGGYGVRLIRLWLQTFYVTKLNQFSSGCCLKHIFSSMKHKHIAQIKPYTQSNRLIFINQMFPMSSFALTRNYNGFTRHRAIDISQMLLWEMMVDHERACIAYCIPEWTFVAQLHSLVFVLLQNSKRGSIHRRSQGGQGSCPPNF